MLKHCLLIALSCYIVACTTRFDAAPVSELTWRAHHTLPLYHQVLSGETLYTVAFRYDMDYRKLADYNQLSPPYTIHIGQRLRLLPFKQVQPKLIRKKSTMISSYHLPAMTDFAWPVTGSILHHFAPHRGQKGIDIIAPRGTPIKAAENGKVVYVGQGLIGYRNLIIIQHTYQYLTAYGHYHQSYVKAGQVILKGQTIGRVGQLNRQYWGVHFEIRRWGQPIHPLRYLKGTARPSSRTPAKAG